MNKNNFKYYNQPFFGIPGGMSKFEEKARISEGLMQKGGKFQGVIIKLTGNPGMSTSKKLISSTGEGYNFFSGKAQ